MVCRRHKVIYLAGIFAIFHIGLSFAFNPGLEMNVDEERSWQIAENHRSGLGYVYYDPYVNDYIPTALTSSIPTFIYEFLLAAGISKPTWVAIVYVITAAAIAVSINVFFSLCLFLMGEYDALIATIAYCLLPSALFFVGRIFYYENLVVPLLVIAVFSMFVLLRRSYSYLLMLAISVITIISISLRYQAIPVFGLLLAAFSIGAIVERRFILLLPIAASAIAIALINVPALIKNHEMFGVYVLGTQSGYELLQGHNPYAKGGWDATWRDPGDRLFDYAHTNIPALDRMNEYEESRARQELALRFIKEQPVSDLLIEIKKLALYFAPFDHTGTRPVFDPFLFVVYSCFFGMMLLKLWHREFTIEDTLLLAPLMGSVVLSLVFFMGPRWRYYAEPFMIIYAVLFMRSMLSRFRESRADSLLLSNV